MTLGLGTRRICAAKTTPTRSATHRASPENFLRSESCPEAVSRLSPLQGRESPAPLRPPTYTHTNLFGFYQSSSKCSGIIMPLGNRIVVSPPESISGTSSWPEAAGRARKTTMQDFVRATTRVPTI